MIKKLLIIAGLILSSVSIIGSASAANSMPENDNNRLLSHYETPQITIREKDVILMACLSTTRDIASLVYWRERGMQEDEARELVFGAQGLSRRNEDTEREMSNAVWSWGGNVENDHNHAAAISLYFWWPSVKDCLSK